jgi:phage baseplate assembly protein W
VPCCVPWRSTLGDWMVAQVSDDVTVPQFAFPFHFEADGRAAVVEQNSDQEVIDCVEVLLRTPVGSRDDLPEYGIDDPTFETEPDVAAILDAIDDWEPRAQVNMDSEIDSKDELMRNITANVSIGGEE